MCICWLVVFFYHLIERTLKLNAKVFSKEIHSLIEPEYLEHAKYPFKTGIGEYAHGDKFLGIRVPKLRKLAKRYKEISIAEIEKLLRSKYHEERLCSLFLLIHHYENGSEIERTHIYKLYLANTKFINNWDLVDSSAYKIVGPYLFKRSRKPLYKLAKSKNLWERRISIIATFHFIKCKQFGDTLELSKLLLDDEEDLIHKAVGWMLREVGKREIDVEQRFLSAYYKNMPRTMLRYAIEKFPEADRKRYLKGAI